MTAQVCRIVFYFCSKIVYILLQMILMTSRPHQPKLLLRSPLPSLLLRKNPLTMTTATAMKRRRPNQLQQRSLQLKKNLPTMMMTIAMKRKRRSPLPSQLLKKLLLKTTATTVRTAVTRRKRRLQLRKLNQSRSPSWRLRITRTRWRRLHRREATTSHSTSQREGRYLFTTSVRKQLMRISRPPLKSSEKLQVILE